MNYLIGTYECKIDVKGRLLIPIALKKQIADSISQGFVLKRAVFQQCLELYPLQQWKDLIAKVNKLNRFKKKNNDFIRRFTAGLRFIELDNTGRLLIPKELTEFANIKREIVLSSSVNIIEIWDKSKYEKTIDDSKSDFAQLAEEVMGDDEN
ncbi:MAG: division/cell wall cluster transcriptional repressor MraZ [Flavobacteriaceae bacterium]|nr:division/cell wall cluster transcriptional repressor MraZ [Flavobacteriaceae bacterium]